MLLAFLQWNTYFAAVCLLTWVHSTKKRRILRTLRNGMRRRRTLKTNCESGGENSIYNTHHSVLFGKPFGVSWNTFAENDSQRCVLFAHTSTAHSERWQGA